MDAVSAFFMQNIVYVYFLYGMAFFAMGLVVYLESGRATEFRFARALRPLAWFGFVHAGHEWFEMFQIFAAHQEGYAAGVVEEAFRTASLALSFLLLLSFGTRLLPDAEQQPRASRWQVAGLAGIWLAGVGLIYLRYRPALADLLVAADVLARYSLGIPGALLATWALLRERRDFHVRGMSRYGRDLLWAALAFFVYGVIGQLFVRPSLVFPSQIINTAMFLRLFGIPVQLLRGLAGMGIAITLGRALRAFELESRLRLARANKARIEAQAAALDAQQRRADDVEALNVQLRATAGELSALVQMARILTSTVDRERLLADALAQIVRSIEGACCSHILLQRGERGLTWAGHHYGPGADANCDRTQLIEVGTAAVQAGRPALVLAGVPEVQVLAADASFDRMSAGCRVIGVPLRTQDQLLGSLVVSALHSDGALGTQSLEMMSAFAQQVAAAVENARLYEVVREREGQLEALVQRLVNTQEEERKRIAGELHDETGQELTALAMGLAAVETHLNDADRTLAGTLVRNLRGLADQAIRELRNVMANLRPAQLDDLGLVPALRWYVQQYGERHPEMSVTLTTERSPLRLPPGIETVLFRVAQEALSNVARHASATQVSMTLEQMPEQARLVVSDNGVGFDVAAPSRHEPGSGLGLVGMRERVQLLGGSCLVESRPGAGTRLTVALPLKK